MADIFLDDRKFVVGAAIADDLQALLDELAGRRAIASSPPTPEGEPQPQQPSLVLLVVGDQEVYVSEAAAPALQALLADHAALLRGNAELIEACAQLQHELAEAVEAAFAPRDALPAAIDWMNATGHFVRADPDGRVRVYSHERPGRCPKGTHLSGHAIATLPAPPE